jgi:uncharacterized membrane protein YphA (DoxX/SURF4 family)
MNRAERAAVWVLAGVFGAAAVLKIADPAAFAASIDRLGLVPRPLLGALAILLPWTELGAAIGLLIPSERRAAAWLSLGLLVAFSGALAWGLARGASTCGCFGSGDARLDVALLRNAFLIALAALTSRPRPAAPASPA